MILRTMSREWWVILLQGVFMIALSIIIFKYPGTVLTVVAIWLGVIVIITGMMGVIAWFTTDKADREPISVLASLAILVIGTLMITKMIATIKAITVVFGLIILLVGTVLISAGWGARKHWPAWWLVALLGVASVAIGLKSIFDIFYGAESLSNFIGIGVLLSGIGLIALAFLKKKLVNRIKEGINEIRTYES